MNEKVEIVPRKRPEELKGETRLVATGCGKLYVTINEDVEGQLFEVFTSMGKAGGCAASQAEAIGRLVSLAFRSGIAPEAIIKQLKGISCHQPSWGQGGRIRSCADAIAVALKRRLGLEDHSQEPGGEEAPGEIEEVLRGACPDCGGAMKHESGCEVCTDCGFSNCG